MSILLNRSRNSSFLRVMYITPSQYSSKILKIADIRIFLDYMSCMTVSYKKQNLLTLCQHMGSALFFVWSLLLIFFSFSVVIFVLFVFVLCLMLNNVYVSGMSILDFPLGYSLTSIYCIQYTLPSHISKWMALIIQVNVYTTVMR